jgi:hypothetical protein
MDRVPIFVKLPEELDIKGLLDSARDKLQHVRVSLEEINSLSKQEAEIISEWKVKCDAIDKRIENTKLHLVDQEQE